MGKMIDRYREDRPNGNNMSPIEGTIGTSEDEYINKVIDSVFSVSQTSPEGPEADSGKEHIILGSQSLEEFLIEKVSHENPI